MICIREPIESNCHYRMISPGALSLKHQEKLQVKVKVEVKVEVEVEGGGGRQHLGVTRGILHMIQPQLPSPDANTGVQSEQQMRNKREETHSEMVTGET